MPRQKKRLRRRHEGFVDLDAEARRRFPSPSAPAAPLIGMSSGTYMDLWEDALRAAVRREEFVWQQVERLRAEKACYRAFGKTVHVCEGEKQ